MNMQKYNPFNWFKDEDTHSNKPVPSNRQPQASHPFLQLHQEIDRLFDDAFRGFGAPSLAGFEQAFNNSSLLKPHVDIAESEKEYQVTVEVPGVEEDDVKLELADGTLTLSGEKKVESEKKDKNFHRVERSYGSFRRVLTLPEDVDQDNIEAAFKNGVLSLSLPRKAQAKSDVKRIDIKKIA